MALRKMSHRKWEIAYVEEYEFESFVNDVSENTSTEIFIFSDGILFVKCSSKMKLYYSGLFDGWRLSKRAPGN
jgi:hypothetical protein